jgi:hypothetical protein
MLYDSLIMITLTFESYLMKMRGSGIGARWALGIGQTVLQFTITITIPGAFIEVKKSKYTYD